MAKPSARARDWQHEGDRRYWLRILTANALGAVVAYGLLGGLITPAPWGLRTRTLIACLVYANSIGVVMALLIPLILRRIAECGSLLYWTLRLAMIPVLTVAGCAVAGVVLIAIGISRPTEYWQFLRGSLWISLLVGTAVSLAATAYETLHGRLEAASLALKTKELDEERARALAIEAQLASLESRVHPHFLFNTLNSIASLAHDDPSAAERVVGQLASLLRSSLDGGSVPLVRLDEELRVVRDYLEIERVRFGDRLRYTIEAPPEASSVLVPRLSLQTLVENGVKHAVSRQRGGATVAVRGVLAADRLRLEVADDGPGFDSTQVPAGHGLALVQTRLAMLFGGRAALAIESAPGCTRVALSLPLDGPG